MRVIVIGATGNVGTAVVDALTKMPSVTSIVGAARRVPEHGLGGVEWVGADVRAADLVSLMRGADAVVHLAWLFQPTHRPLTTWATNVDGTARVLSAVARAGVPALVYASSVGAYSPRADDRPVSEAWPTEGWPPAAYMAEKAYVERLLDIFERDHPDCRLVRLRPAFTFQYSSASEQRRLFAGPLVPNRLLRPGAVPVLPFPSGLRFQALHSSDVGRAYALAVTGTARGAFNIAADPVLDRAALAQILGARTVSVPPRLVKAALAVGWRLRLLPATPELFDAMMHLPLMDTSRARDELGWTPRVSATEAVTEFLAGFGDGAGADTPPLARDAGGAWRYREFASGVGGHDPVDQRAHH
ncbi:NAD-dependent epimerase/dehydratase family protein [Nocardia halotolerans]|uniref:NAD-dependent epimerase/dehydratase family protein n=1 Tax=Nocardia halotolerans TaxID=1755878 RepID=A0ABV8VN42_9NOCA